MGQGSGRSLAGLSYALELLKVSIGYWPVMWSYLNLIGERSTSKLTWVLEKSRSIHATGFNASISGWLLARGMLSSLTRGPLQLASHSWQLTACSLFFQSHQGFPWRLALQPYVTQS